MWSRRPASATRPTSPSGGPTRRRAETCDGVGVAVEAGSARLAPRVLGHVDRAAGPHFDLHTGGVDHREIHHPNEDAQSRAYLGDGQPWVRYWLHNEFVSFAGEKMSKSKGNVLTLDDVVERGLEPMAYRLLLLQSGWCTSASPTPRRRPRRRRAVAARCSFPASTPRTVMAGLADPSGSAFFVVEADAAGQPDRSGRPSTDGYDRRPPSRSGHGPGGSRSHSHRAGTSPDPTTPHSWSPRSWPDTRLPSDELHHRSALVLRLGR